MLQNIEAMKKGIWIKIHSFLNILHKGGRQ